MIQGYGPSLDTRLGRVAAQWDVYHWHVGEEKSES